MAALVLLLLLPGCARDPRLITEAVGDMAVVVEDNNAFAVDLYQAARDEPGNLFFSPFSVNAALSMLLAGAEGQTEQQIADVLHVGLDEQAWHDNLAALFADLSGEHGRGYTLLSANAVWGQEGVPFRQDFADLMEISYGAPIRSVNFTADPGAVTDEVNDWVADQTRGHIDPLFQPGDIDDLTRLVLANAIYFEADWASRFDAASTSQQPFTRSDGSTVQVPMMSQESELGYGWDEGLQILELPYEDDEISMVILLPEEADGLPALEEALTAEALAGWLDGLGSVEVAAQIPSFELEAELPLSELLMALGMVDAFDQGAADFTGLVAAEDMGGNWCVQASRHKAWVQVDEAGTTAAAATGVAVGLRSVSGPTTFVADHPFLFLIRDMLTGAVLFVGRVEDPS